MIFLECGIRDILRVLVLARNSVYSARSVEDAIPHVYKMEGHRSFHESESFNFIIAKAIFGRFFSEKCYFI